MLVTLRVYAHRPILAARPRPFYNFHTRRLRIAHANAHTPNAYAPNTHIARTFEAYIVRIDRFTTPVATFACGAAPPHPRERSRIEAHISTHTIIVKEGVRETKRTRRKTANEFRLTASSKGGAGIGLGAPGVVSGEQAESETPSSLLLGRRTTLRPETGEYVLFERGVGKKARSKSK